MFVSLNNMSKNLENKELYLVRLQIFAFPFKIYPGLLLFINLQSLSHTFGVQLFLYFFLLGIQLFLTGTLHATRTEFVQQEICQYEREQPSAGDDDILHRMPCRVCTV